MTALPAPRRRLEVIEQPSRFVLVPWEPREVMTIANAARFLCQSEANVRRLCARYDLGRRVGGPWAVSRVALTMYAENASKALRLYHQGDRSSPEVVAYYRRLGIPVPASVMVPA